MTDYTQAADALKRMAVQYKNIVAVADALESLGSIQGAAKEADAALAKARKDRDAFVVKFTQEMAKAKDDLAVAQAAADKTLAEAKQQADDKADGKTGKYEGKVGEKFLHDGAM